MDLPKTGDLLLGKYRLEKLLGEGGLGVVYAAHHELLGKRVAVKVIRPEYALHSDTVARFLNEARAAARIENDHVARVLDVGILDGALPYMVLEYLDGSDLSQVLRQRKVLPFVDVVDCMLQTIEGVAQAHAAGIVHRDLKPSNLYLARRPDGPSRVKVVDFGISKATSRQGASANLARANSTHGSSLYMSPEQLRDPENVDFRCDIWALGVIAYELLTGRPPYHADNAGALFAAIMSTTPASLSVLRPEAAALQPIVMKCLGRSVEDRYSSVTDLGVALAPYGTVASARALANTKRILPLRDSARYLAPANVGVSPIAAKIEVPGPPPESSRRIALRTAPHDSADPWASSRTPSAAPRRNALAAIVVAAVLIVAVVVSLVARRTDAHRAPAAASDTPVVPVPVPLPFAAPPPLASSAAVATSDGPAVSAVPAAAAVVTSKRPPVLARPIAVPLPVESRARSSD